jgi:uncharacterized protein (DUF1501 family)
MNPLTRYNRRQFLRQTALGGSLAGTAPAFVASTFHQLHAQADARATAAVTGKDGPILVVLQLAGGNDGLNTLVPYSNDDYQRARPNLGLKAPEVLKLNDHFGFHPGLRGFQELHDAGQLAILHAVGYPNPNRSHFRSTEIWATATDSQRVERHGWIGRYFDHACAGADPTVGIAIGRQLPQAFGARVPKGISLDNPNAYRFMEGDAGDDGEEKTYREMAEGMDPSQLIGNSGGSIGSLAGRAQADVDPIDFLERTALAAQISSDRIRSVADRVPTMATYPSGSLAQSLRLVAKLIGGQLGTRVFYVSQGGYDTHTNQRANHERLLRELGDSLRAFMQDLKAQGSQDQVLVMTFSEFGRRVSENASAGTDHGAGAPLFVVGSRVKPGFHGIPPGLATAQRINGDVRFSTDFRQVYGTILEHWLKTPSSPVLGRSFPRLDFI